MVLDELSFTYVDNLIVAFDEKIEENDVNDIWAKVTDQKVQITLKDELMFRNSDEQTVSASLIFVFISLKIWRTIHPTLTN